MTRRSLSDILAAGDQGRLQDAWGHTEAAEDFAPLPVGEYIARIIAAELFTSKTKGTAGYKLTFRVLEGRHEGRHFWHDVWLTPAALPMAKRDLGKLGITSLEQLELLLPPGIRCQVKLTLRRDDDGTEFNRVRSFDVIGIDSPEDDTFAPDAASAKGEETDAATDTPKPPQDVAGGEA